MIQLDSRQLYRSSLWKQQFAPENLAETQNESSFPTIDFQVQTVSFREDTPQKSNIDTKNDALEDASPFKPHPKHSWVDDFPFPFRWDMLIFPGGYFFPNILGSYTPVI